MEKYGGAAQIAWACSAVLDSRAAGRDMKIRRLAGEPGSEPCDFRMCAQGIDRRVGPRQQRLAEHQAVGEAQRALAKRRHNQVRDAVAQTSLDEAAGQEEGDGDQPEQE